MTLRTLPYVTELGGTVTHRHRNGNYYMVSVRDHPFYGPYRQILEHRLILGDKIGRPLKRGEHSHHKDEDTTNNEPYNLELKVAGDHHRLHKKGVKISKEHHKKICKVLQSQERREFQSQIQQKRISCISCKRGFNHGNFSQHSKVCY